MTGWLPRNTSESAFNPFHPLPLLVSSASRVVRAFAAPAYPCLVGTKTSGRVAPRRGLSRTIGCEKHGNPRLPPPTRVRPFVVCVGQPPILLGGSNLCAVSSTRVGLASPPSVTAGTRHPCGFLALMGGVGGGKMRSVPYSCQLAAKAGTADGQHIR
jgi:hypothetical protein